MDEKQARRWLKACKGETMKLSTVAIILNNELAELRSAVRTNQEDLEEIAIAWMVEGYEVELGLSYKDNAELTKIDKYSMLK